MLPPVIDFKHEVTSECEGEVQFTDLSTNYPNEWSWNFGDGNTSTEQNPLHQYEQSGDYTVSLNAKNIKGATEGNKTMTLENVLYIQVDLPMFPEKGKPCQFVDKTVGAKDWFWDFGNGKVSIGKANPLTVYSDPGTYQVTLEVTDDKGCVRQKTFTIEAVTVGIDNPGANMLNIGVQPNPATDKVIIDANFIGQQNINLSVYDLLGREVYANSSVAANTYKHTLDVAHFAQGVYMVTITNGNVSRTQKLVVE
ncbi:MAG: PKD domain-containing protein [Sphingobacteriales bacterium]|nr:PKD domain-containing protein [Sphingobacteriales bacterium]